MGELLCADGSTLSVVPVPCRDRAGQPYEITLQLVRDAAPFALVGERCGDQLRRLAEQLRAARQDSGQAASWPDPDDRFPGPRPMESFLPGDCEYFSLRSRDRGDPAGAGELRCTIRSAARWIGPAAEARPAGPPGLTGLHGITGVPGVTGLHGITGVPGMTGLPGPAGVARPAGVAGVTGPGQHGLPWQRPWPRRTDKGPASARGAAGRIARRAGVPGAMSARGTVTAPGAAVLRGGWQLTRRAVIEAWGAGGIGIRAVLTSAELVTFLDTVLREPDFAGMTGSPSPGAEEARTEPGSSTSPMRRQRGRVPDGSARPRLPAVRAKARGIAVAPGDPQACRGDVRW
ncbi:MAG: hypothetical protein ACLPN6_30140 [Streptosporangiaceae bacterium]